MIYRSYLYVPGHDEHRIPKAYGTDADCVVLDLEDAVPATQKDRARIVAGELLRQPPPKPTHIRLSGDWAQDIQHVAGPCLETVRVPKATPERVRAVADLLDEADCGAHIVPVIESALGLECAMDIALASDRIERMTLGEADLRAELRVTSDDGLLYARLRLVSVSAAAGLTAPIQSIFTQVADHVGLAETSRWGRSVGYIGRSAVHPSQIHVINAAFMPTPDELAAATRVLEFFEKSARSEAAAALLPDGTFVDPAVVKAARTTIRLAREDAQ